MSKIQGVPDMVNEIGPTRSKMEHYAINGIFLNQTISKMIFFQKNTIVKIETHVSPIQNKLFFLLPWCGEDDEEEGRRRREGEKEGKKIRSRRRGRGRRMRMRSNGPRRGG